MESQIYCHRRSNRLFKRFIEQNATKDVVDMVEWIQQKLHECQAPIQEQIVVNDRSLVIEREQIAQKIYSTILYQEWNSPSKNDRMFRKPVFISTMISKLNELINLYGQKWASEWAIPVKNEVLKIKNKRFGSCVQCGCDGCDGHNCKPDDSDPDFDDI